MDELAHQRIYSFTHIPEGKKMKNITKISQKILCARVISLACVLVLLRTPVISSAESLPETGKLIPPETVVLVDIGNFSQLRTQFEKTNYYKLYKDPAMAAFVEDFKTKLREKVKQMDNELVRTIFDTGIWPQGRVAVGLVLNEQTKDANEPPILFITQWGQSIDKIKEAVDKMVQKAIENGAHRKTEDYRGVSVTTITRNRSSSISYCFMDDCLAGAMNLDILKFVIAHIQGASSPALASDADYSAAMKVVGPYHDVDFYVNIKHLIQMAVVEDTTGKEKTTIANLGLDNVTSIGFSIGVSREANSNSCGRAFVKVDGAKRGICRMLDAEPATISAPLFIPASAYSVTFLNLNIKKTYDEIYNILCVFDPQFAVLMQTPLVPPGPEGEPGVQLKPDIIDHLGSQIVIAQSVNKQFSGVSAQTPAETLIAAAVTNRSALEKSLSLLHSKIIAQNKPDAKRELLGHTIYLIDFSALLPAFVPGEKTPMQARRASGGQVLGAPVSGAVTPIPEFAFTITDTHLIFGTESAVEQTIRALSSTQAGTLSSATWFNKAKSAIPSVVGLAALQDNVASSEIFWKMIKEMGKSANKSSGASMGTPISPFPQMMFGEPGFDLFNLSLLPEFDTVRKYFGLSASYGVSKQDGFFFEFKDINTGGTAD
jgi:hypothetical protein